MCLRRERKLNFAEVEMSKEAFKNLLLKAGYERYGNDFLKAKANYSVELFGRPFVNLFASVLYDIQSSGHNFEIGAKSDIIDLLQRDTEII